MLICLGVRFNCTGSVSNRRRSEWGFAGRARLARPPSPRLRGVRSFMVSRPELFVHRAKKPNGLRYIPLQQSRERHPLVQWNADRALHRERGETHTQLRSRSTRLSDRYAKTHATTDVPLPDLVRPARPSRSRDLHPAQRRAHQVRNRWSQ